MRLNRTVLTLLVLSLLLDGGAAAIATAEAGKKVLRAGAATSNITPWLGEAIVGNWNTPPASHVHDELHARCLVLDDGATRIAIQRELELAVRKPTAKQLLHAKQLLADPQRPDTFPHERTYAQRIMRQQEAPATIRVIVQALRIGDLGIAASPFETFAETGLEIKAKSPLKPTCTIELANGCYGYLPTPAQHQLGGYETWLGTNRVEIEASTRLTAALLDMFGELQ